MRILVGAVLVTLWLFAQDDGAFAPSSGGVQWEWGVPTSGPGGTDTVWGTQLGGNYLNDATDALEVPVPDLTGIAFPVLLVEHWYEIQPGDLAWFEVNDGNGWVLAEPIYGYPGGGTGFAGSSAGWTESTLDLRGLGTAPQVRLVFRANASLTSAGWYLSKVELHDGDVTAPRVSPLISPIDTEIFSGTYPVQVVAEDDVAVVSATLEVTANSAPMAPIPMTDLGAGVWEGRIPAQAHRTAITWRAVATDGTQEGVYPETGTESFVVELRKPTNFMPLEPQGRVVGNVAAFVWTAPQSLHAVDGYWIRAVDVQGLTRTVVDQTWVDGSLSDGLAQLQPQGARSFDLVAEYQLFGPSEPTDVVDVVLEAAELTSVQPSVGYQGERVRVRIRGENLYLDGGDFVVFDGRVVAEPLVVETVNDASAVIEIPIDAPTGPVGIALNTQWGTYRFDDAFTIRAASEAPRIVDVTPSKVRQGDAATVRMTASAPFAGPVIVDGGDLLLVEDPVVDGAVLTLELVVGGGAAPGPHLIILDDGSRLWEAELVVEERVFTGNTGCGGCNGAPNAPGFAPWWLLLMVTRRRR